MIALKFGLILLLTLGYAIWAEWLDWYHAIVAGIPFAVLFLILILLEVKRARDAEEEGEEDERSVIPTVIAAVVFTLILLAITNGVVWLIDTKTDFAASFFDTDKVTFKHDLDLLRGVNAWGEVEAKIRERLLPEHKISKSFNQQLVQEAYDAMIEQARAATTSEEKVRHYERAEQWALEKGLKPDLAVAELKNARPTATPTIAPTPRPTVTPTPKSPIKPNVNNPCPKINALIRSDFRLQELLQGESKDIARSAAGAFVNKKVVVVTIPEGFKQVCLSSTSDGVSAPKTDDQIEMVVRYGGQTISPPFVLNFYDMQTAGISEIPAQDLGWIFTRPGEYIIELTLRDTIPSVYSTSALWIIIW